MPPRVQATGGMTLGHGRQDERMMAPAAGHGACSRVGRPAWAVVVESVPEHHLSSVDRAHRHPSLRRREDARGQSLVEFALVVPVFLLVLLAIVQFGFIFNAQVTITNAAREGARAATIYVYDSNLANKATNDSARSAAALAAAKQSLGILDASQFPTIGTNFVVGYSIPTGVQDSDARTGEQVTVTITYRQDLIIPLVANLLSGVTNNKLSQSSTVTMVIN